MQTKRKSNEKILVKAKIQKKIERNVDGENPKIKHSKLLPIFL